MRERGFNSLEKERRGEKVPGHGCRDNAKLKGTTFSPL